VHMWIGLVLGVLLAVLGLSGSLLVYDQAIADLLSPPPRALTAGMPLPLTMLADTAREAAAAQGSGGQMQLILPQKTGDALVVRMGGISPMGNMVGMRREGRGLQIYMDPVSGEVLAVRTSVLPSFLTFAHQLHGNFVMGRGGRSFVGWLGVAMCILGLTGLVLWWPRRGQWKYAFKVRSEATGLRFHRELHAAIGIWMFVIFMAVSFSGVVIAWPQTVGLNPPGRPPAIVPTDGRRLGATEAVIAATTAVPGLQARSVTIPASPDQPISVNYLSNGAIAATVLVDPSSGKVLAVRDASESFLAWMRPVHQGSLNAVWRFLIFLSGLAPALFVTTGLLMWWKKRQRHVPMTMMTDDVMADEA
jgi:uncharacterized iron-regulated membrane protein